MYFLKYLSDDSDDDSIKNIDTNLINNCPICVIEYNYSFRE